MASGLCRLPSLGSAFVLPMIFRQKPVVSKVIYHAIARHDRSVTITRFNNSCAHTRLMSTTSRLHGASGASSDDGKSKLPPLSKAESDWEGEFDAVSARKVDPNAPVDTDYLNRKDWISHGFSFVDKDEDNLTFHMWCFGVFTIMFGGLGWLIAYKPHNQHLDWVAREANLELRRRERLGLPLVGPDLIPRDRIVLPTEEELGDFDVHI